MGLLVIARSEPDENRCEEEGRRMEFTSGAGNYRPAALFRAPRIEGEDDDLTMRRHEWTLSAVHKKRGNEMPRLFPFGRQKFTHRNDVKSAPDS